MNNLLKYISYVCLVVGAASICQNNDQSPLQLIEDFIAKQETYKDLSYSHFLNTIINEYGEYTKIESLLYTEGLAEKSECIGPYVCRAQETVKYQIELTTQCLSSEIQFQLGTKYQSNNPLSEFECLTVSLENATKELRNIYDRAVHSCIDA